MISTWRPKEATSRSLWGSGLPLLGLGELLWTQDTCWGSVPLAGSPCLCPIVGLRIRGTLRAAERGLVRWWTSPLDLPGLAQQVCGCAGQGHTWAHTMCSGVCVQGVCVPGDC